MRRFLPISLMVTALLVMAVVVTGCDKFGGPKPLTKKDLAESESGQFPPEGEEAKRQLEGRDQVKIADLLSRARHVPDDEARHPNPLPATETNLESGRLAYNNECASCHGLAGFGDGEAAKGFSPPAADLHEEYVQMLPDGAISYLIRHGIATSRMPGVEGRLSEEQVWQLVLFVRTFDRFSSPAIVH